LARVAGCIPRWFDRPKAVTHLGSNRARCRVTSLIIGLLVYVDDNT